MGSFKETQSAQQLRCQIQAEAKKQAFPGQSLRVELLPETSGTCSSKATRTQEAKLDQDRQVLVAFLDRIALRVAALLQTQLRCC